VNKEFPKIDKNDHYFLGYFEVCHMQSTNPKTLEQIRKNEFEPSLIRQVNKRWAEGRALSVVCTLIPDSLLKKLPMLCPTRDRIIRRHTLREICVIDTPTNQIMVPIEKQHLTKILSCEEGTSGRNKDHPSDIINSALSRQKILELHLHENFGNDVFSKIVSSAEDIGEDPVVPAPQLSKLFDRTDSFHRLALQRYHQFHPMNYIDVYSGVVNNLNKSKKRGLLKLLLHQFKLPDIIPQESHSCHNNTNLESNNKALDTHNDTQPPNLSHQISEATPPLLTEILDSHISNDDHGPSVTDSDIPEENEDDIDQETHDPPNVTEKNQG
jgi:hypothetical protein